VQSGKLLRLRGKGIPGLSGREGGDQLVRIIVVMPTKLTAEQRKHYEALARTMGDEPPKLQKGFLERMREALGG